MQKHISTLLAALLLAALLPLAPRAPRRAPQPSPTRRCG